MRGVEVIDEECLLSLVSVEPFRLGFDEEAEVVLSTVLASEMALSNSRCSPDPDPSASSRLNCRHRVEL